MAHPGIEGAATVIVLVPADRVEGAHPLAHAVGPGRLRTITALVHAQQVDQVFRARRPELIPFVGEQIAWCEAFHTGEVGILDLHDRGLDRGMDVEHMSHHPGVPRPVVLDVGRTVHADVAAAAPDEALEGRLLGRVEHVAGGEQEDHRLVLRQLGIVHHPPGVGAPEHLEVVQLAQFLHRRHAGMHGIVVPGRRFGKQQHIELGRLRRGWQDAGKRAGEDEDGKRTDHWRGLVWWRSGQR